MPFFNSEVCYEGIGESCRDEVQRYMFWTCMMLGACGHTYGANGIWQFNGSEIPYGPSPHGMAWGHTPWEEAYKLPGCAHVAFGKRLLERFEWWRFEPHTEWIDPHLGEPDFFGASAAGIPGKVRVIYLPSIIPWDFTVRQIEEGVEYSAVLYSARDGNEQRLGSVEPDADGGWQVPLKMPPVYHDWVLILEAGL